MEEKGGEIEGGEKKELRDDSKEKEGIVKYRVCEKLHDFKDPYESLEIH